MGQEYNEKKCFLFTYHPSSWVVHWWVLIHSGQEQEGGVRELLIHPLDSIAHVAQKCSGSLENQVCVVLCVVMWLQFDWHNWLVGVCDSAFYIAEEK
jgi:hypothetical protein